MAMWRTHPSNARCRFCTEPAFSVSLRYGSHGPALPLCISHFDNLNSLSGGVLFDPYGGPVPDPKTTPKFLLLDFETTGLMSENCYPLEVAIIILTEELQPLGAWATTIAAPPSVLANLDREHFVYKTYTQNGLLAVQEDGTAFQPQGAACIAGVEEYLLQICDQFPQAPILAGASPQALDLPLIQRWMPTLFKRLSHRVYDVSAVPKTLCDGVDWSMGDLTHRAMPDCELELALMQKVKGLVER